MVFHRYLGVCENHIWAKDLTNQREYRLTDKSAVYGQHSWSMDGTQLAFTVQQNCAQDQTEKEICWQLHTLDFAAAIQAPQPTVQRLNCETRRTSEPRWLDDGSILTMEHGSNNKIVRYHPATDTLSDFYVPDNNQLVHFDVSDDAAQVAAFEQDNMLNISLKLLDSAAQVVSSSQVTMPKYLSVFQRFEPDFRSDTEGFVFNTGQGLFALSYEGDITPIEFLGPQRLYTPKLHPSGEKLLATQGELDADIASFSLAPISKTKQDIRPESFACSNSYDATAKFQPNGDYVAFLSRRSGSAQVWLANGEEVRQLSTFESRTQVSSVVWSPDGHAIATVANDRIWLLSMDGTKQVVDLDFPVRSIFQWRDNNQLLIEANVTSAYQVLLFDIQYNSVEHIGIANAYFAHYLDDERLVYIDAKRIPFLVENGKASVINGLQNDLDSKRFFVKENRLYGMNWKNQFWHFDLASGELERLSNMHKGVWWVSDIRGQNVLSTTMIAAPKEIIELSLQAN